MGNRKRVKTKIPYPEGLTRMELYGLMHGPKLSLGGGEGQFINMNRQLITS
jgi:hypothetical protein